MSRRCVYNNGVIVEVRIMGNSIEGNSLINHHSHGIDTTVLNPIMRAVREIADAAFQAPSRHTAQGRYFSK